MALGHLYDSNALVVSPTEAMIDWVNSIFPHSPEDYSNELTDDGAAIYLIPDFEYHKEAMEWLKDNYHDIFVEELSGWTEDETFFPPVTWENFIKFCRVSYQSMVHVVADEEE